MSLKESRVESGQDKRGLSKTRDSNDLTTREIKLPCEIAVSFVKKKPGVLLISRFV
jgi:hypothetical protein